jgi:hypothetical protein
MIIEDAEKLEIPASVEELREDEGALERLLAEMTGLEVDEDAPEVDLPIGSTPVVGDPTEGGGIGPEPMREDVESAIVDVNVKDVIEAERVEEESE